MREQPPAAVGNSKLPLENAGRITRKPPANVAGEEGTRRLMQLIPLWCIQKHAHIQFNILNKQTLREAQKNPEKYRDLVVRIAGYCAYFVDLTPAQQEELIARTEEQ